MRWCAYRFGVWQNVRVRRMVFAVQKPSTLSKRCLKFLRDNFHMLVFEFFRYFSYKCCCVLRRKQRFHSLGVALLFGGAVLQRGGGVSAWCVYRFGV